NYNQVFKNELKDINKKLKKTKIRKRKKKDLRGVGRCFYNLFLASLLLFSMLKTSSCSALLYPIFLTEKQLQCW
ncbi:hypothetical protein NDJ34_19815, partial [Acinetobacter baumannii]|nr:hypothetical protein [Acinetobacter baumannii]